MDNTPAVPAPDRHAVKFYGDDASLYTTVATFLGESLVAGQPAIVIATPEHREAILTQLSARFINVTDAQETGDLLLLDAEETLSTFLVDGEPDQQLFKDNIGGIISGVLMGRPPRTVVRAYGEMVDLLWKRERPKQAIRLEILWNQLALTHGFALLCGYSIGNFYKQAEEFQEVCRQHSQIMPPEENVVVLESRRATRTA